MYFILPYNLKILCGFFYYFLKLYRINHTIEEQFNKVTFKFEDGIITLEERLDFCLVDVPSEKEFMDKLLPVAAGKGIRFQPRINLLVLCDKIPYSYAEHMKNRGVKAEEPLKVWEYAPPEKQKDYRKVWEYREKRYTFEYIDTMCGIPMSTAKKYMHEMQGWLLSKS